MIHRIAVNPMLIDWAMARAPDIVRLQQRFSKLNEWRSGETQPTLNQLESFARATLTPFGYFFLKSPPQVGISIPHYRTMKDKSVAAPSPNLVETVQDLERRQAWLREYLAEHGYEPLDFVSSDKDNKSTEQVAEHIRRRLQLTPLWASEQKTWTDALAELRNRIDSTGILISISGIVGSNTKRTLDPNEFRGFVLVDEYAPAIFVNGADSKAAQMFTMAHELAHVWLGKSAAFDLTNLESAPEANEQLCNAIAAEFLVPSKYMLEYWTTVKGEHAPIEAAARHFKVSQLVIARRALDLQLLTRAQFFAFYKQYADREYLESGTKSSGGDFYKTTRIRLGKRFTQTVIRAAREGSLLYRDAYILTGLYGDTFEKLAHSYE